MVEALGDRAGVAAACGNLGACYYRTGDYGRARELHEQHKAMAEELGDRAGVLRWCVRWRRAPTSANVADVAATMRIPWTGAQNASHLRGEHAAARV